MRCVLWGAGRITQRVISSLRQLDIVAVVDSDTKKQGTRIQDYLVISPKEYLQSYKDLYVIIMSPRFENEIKLFLEENDVFHYFLFSQGPSDLYYPRSWTRFPFEEVLGYYEFKSNKCKIVIGGVSFFGIMAYEFLSAEGFDDIAVFDDEIGLEMAQKLVGDGYRVISESEGIVNSIILLIRYDYYEAFSKSNTIIPFYSFPYLKDNDNSRLSFLYRKHEKANRCFIVANGPSLRYEDLDTLASNHEICFGVNEIFKAFKHTKWRPTYFLASDLYFYDHTEDEIDSIEAEYLFFGDFSEGRIVSPKSNRIKYHPTGIPTWNLQHGIVFSEDISVAIYTHQTIIYECLQFACYMGFKKIYIIGADCEIKDNENTHFCKDYLEGLKVPYGLNLPQMMLGYQSAKDYADRHFIQIFNATRGGKLDIFKRVKFDDLFR